ncbi:MAG TPA: creatininase family protein [Blastocatellia bacterium]|nr:creatininase family protein [Blastocatellia bacterium]
MNKEVVESRRRTVASLIALPAMMLGGIPARRRPEARQPEQRATEPEREFVRITGYRLDEHVRESQLALLPLGSIEYHGPSGPPMTDSIIAAGLAERVAPRVKASVFPVVMFSHCPAHTAQFRGSVSIRPEVMTMYLADILRGIVANGFRRVFLLNGHDGNIGPARMAMSQVTADIRESQMMLVNWWETLPTPLVESLRLFTSGNGGHGHGGPLELSVAAVFAPASVEAGKGPDLPALTPLIEGVPFYLEKSQAENWPGYSGKLSEISREKGEKLVALAVEKLSTLIEEWIKKPTHPGSW